MKKIKALINHPLFSGSAIMFVGNMGANVINYAYHLIMGRLLGPIEYGILASLYSVLYIVGIIPSSASIAIVKFTSSAKDSDVYSVYEAIRKVVFKLAVFLSLLLIFFSPAITSFLNIKNYFLILLISPVLFFSLITLVNQSASQGLLKFMGSVVPTLLSSFLKLIFGVLLVWIGWTSMGAMVGVVVGAIFAYIYSYKYVERNITKTKLKKINLKPFFSYSYPVLLQSLSFTSIFTIDVILAKHFLDPFSAGIYAAISTLGKIIFFATSPITATMFPVISKRRSLNQSYLKIFFASLALTFFLSGFVTFLFWIFPNIAIGLLYGKEYLSASIDLVWMGIFMLFYAMSNLLVNFSLSTGKVKVVLIPLVAAVAQALMIWFYHNSILQIIQSSLIVSLLMFICLIVYTGYNLYYESKHEK